MTRAYTLSYHFFGPRDERNHLELFVDSDGRSRLATWQHHPRSPDARAGHRLRFRRTAPHRRIYLAFSGSISNGRGRLRILRRGRVNDRRGGVPGDSILVTL